MVLGTGIDIFPVARLERELDRWGREFLSAFLSPEEECVAHTSAWSITRLAASFAGKEAILKALGTGREPGMHWTDIEILPCAGVDTPFTLVAHLGDPDAEIRVHDAVRARARDIGVDWISLELGIDQGHVIATAIAGNGDRPNTAARPSAQHGRPTHAAHPNLPASHSAQRDPRTLPASLVAPASHPPQRDPRTLPASLVAPAVPLAEGDHP